MRQVADSVAQGNDAGASETVGAILGPQADNVAAFTSLDHKANSDHIARRTVLSEALTRLARSGECSPFAFAVQRP